ncbi:hypothetical protein WJX74_008936 [Apatococcus lobatus]|uniref:peptide-methionine (S)-S-oxide reductase n=2 Tax=Apatococcus TaxID=904362 RepID=A0AAW1SRX0_9CHLO
MAFATLTKGIPSVSRLAHRPVFTVASFACKHHSPRAASPILAPAQRPFALPALGRKESSRKSSSFIVMAGTQAAPASPPSGLEYAAFAGGCFWGTELAFQRVPGVVKTAVGYTQGQQKNPTYDSVCGGRTGHTEGVLVEYDPKECSYESLLDAFFAQTDPTTTNQQGNDMGTQYRSGIYYYNDAQKAVGEKAIAKVNEQLENGSFRRVRGGKKVVSDFQPATEFYIAEDYHQQYLSKGGRFSRPQDASKGATTPIRCYG